MGGKKQKLERRILSPTPREKPHSKTKKGGLVRPHPRLKV